MLDFLANLDPLILGAAVAAWLGVVGAVLGPPLLARARRGGDAAAARANGHAELARLLEAAQPAG